MRYDPVDPRIQASGWNTVPMMVDRCVFVDGEHVYQGTDCPHEDEEVGWTVQSG